MICLDPNQEVPLKLDGLPVQLTVRPLTSRKFIERQNLWKRIETAAEVEEQVRLLDELVRLYLVRAVNDRGAEWELGAFLANGISQKGKWKLLDAAAEATELDPLAGSGSASTPASSPASSAPSAKPPASA